MKAKTGLVLVAAILLLVGGCNNNPKGFTRAVYMLVDTSGTYVREIGRANKIIRALVTEMEPGDAFMLARIDSDSFSEKDVIINVSFDRRSSRANVQKLELIKRVDKFVKNVKSSRYTDITGGVLQAVEYLKRSNAANKSLIIFSDLKEDLRRDQFRNVKIDFSGISVVSVNVTKLKSDARDPRKYFRRLKRWSDRVEKTNGTWQVIPADDFSKIVSAVMR